MGTRLVAVGVVAVAQWVSTARADITVFAAAGTMPAMKALARQYRAQGGETVRFNFAASGPLVRMMEQGAPADVFVSANTQWMDYVVEHHLVRPESRVDVAGTVLVLIAPLNSTLRFSDLPQGLKGRLAVGDFKSVPAGTYAREALQAMGWLDAVSGKLAVAMTVRAALMLVEHGEVDAGIVYRSVATSSDKVKIIGTFPEASHAAICFPAACTLTAGDAAREFLRFIAGPEARATWRKHGFGDPPGTVEPRDDV